MSPLSVAKIFWRGELTPLTHQSYPHVDMLRTKTCNFINKKMTHFWNLPEFIFLVFVLVLVLVFAFVLALVFALVFSLLIVFKLPT